LRRHEERNPESRKETKERYEQRNPEKRKKMKKRYENINQVVRSQKRQMKRTAKKLTKHDMKLLCSGCYISNSEIFHQYDDGYDKEKDRERIAEITKTDGELLDKYCQLNQYVILLVYNSRFSEAQRDDIGGWRIDEHGQPAVQKISRCCNEGDYYICPYCDSYRFVDEVERSKGYRWDCCDNGTLRSLIELEKSRPESKFAKYYFGDDQSATIFRKCCKSLNSLFAFTSAGVKPLLDEMKWQDCYKYQGATITVQHGDMYHYLAGNVVRLPIQNLFF
jgi:hypothetical protein